MTIAIGINLGSYAILAADTRTTYHLFGMPFYDDSSSKVQKTTMGLITGAGFCTLLDGVKKKLATEQVADTERVLRIIKEETEMTRNAWRVHPQIESWIEQTGWIFSYMTVLNDQPLLRLGVFHPRLNREMYATYEVGDPAIVFPVELDSRMADEVRDLVLKRIKVPTGVADLQSSIEQNSTLIGTVISELQPSCPSISRRFQIGIHSGGQTGISNLVDIKNDGTFSLNIKLDDPSSH
jgi:hypothetical protein